jgi:putative transposase
MKSVAEPRSRINGQYHYMVTEQGVEAARALAKKLLEENKDNICLVAKMMGTTRPTIRRAKIGPLSDESRRPKVCPDTSSPELTKLIGDLRVKLGYGRIRMSGYIKMSLGSVVKPTTIQNILDRLDVPKQTYSRPKVSKPLYDYEQLLPFEHIQIDCKYVEDYPALGKLAFIPRKLGLPAYQWTAIDALTKTKFLAYSHVPPNALFGQWFMLFVVWWLRAHGVLVRIELQADNGAEWAMGSKAKEERIRAMLAPYGASFHSIPAGKKYLQGIVERTHRTDDEEFYRPHLGRVKDKGDFIAELSGTKILSIQLDSTGVKVCRAILH